MKHAILILAHKDISQLRHLVSYFSKDCYVFIHIDQKSAISYDEQESLKKDFAQVISVYRKYSVHWGGFSILKAELFLLKEAINHSDADYFHLISGQDYPIKPLHDFLDYFNHAEGKSFVSYVHLPNPKWQRATYDRLLYYYPFEFVNNREKGREKSEKWVNWQKKCHVKRNIPMPFDHLFGGSQWFSISRKATETLLKYTRRHPDFYWRMLFTFAPEEVYIQTVLVNLLSMENIINNNFRFIRWKYENGNIPANLGIEHFHLLAESKGFFARKMEIPLSQILMEKIDDYLLTKQECKVDKSGVWHYRGFSKYNYDDRLLTCLYKYIRALHLEEVIDVGCGCGFYVAALRRLKIKAMGYDANPYTKELSSLLLPQGDIPCDVFDFTCGMEDYDEFDLVICTEVIDHLPMNVLSQFLTNIVKLTKKALLLSWCRDFSQRNKLKALLFLEGKGFHVNVFASAYFNNCMRDIHDYYILENNNLINKENEN